jgi:ribosomal protein L21|tara:strand:- start:2052 stop:2243 length:192 start_codon:yes stop_codon:yes gene_type:complete
MPDLKEKLEDLTKQYKEVAEQALQSATMKTKLEGAIEMTQMLMREEEEAVAAEAEKDTKKVKK